jgi:hypothetical protein
MEELCSLVKFGKEQFLHPISGATFWSVNFTLIFAPAIDDEKKSP